MEGARNSPPWRRCHVAPRHVEKRVPPPNGGHDSLFPAVCRGAPIPIVMLSHTYGSTAMPCVCVDNLYHYHFIEEPRMRLPHPHLGDTTSCTKCYNPKLTSAQAGQRRAPCHSVSSTNPLYYALMNAQYFLPICLGRANCCPAYLISPS
eukprot:COSAG03_NODE_355_length_8649_cov_96.396491_2_plen_149_part_00